MNHLLEVRLDNQLMHVAYVHPDHVDQVLRDLSATANTDALWSANLSGATADLGDAS